MLGEREQAVLAGGAARRQTVLARVAQHGDRQCSPGRRSTQTDSARLGGVARRQTAEQAHVRTLAVTTRGDCREPGDRELVKLVAVSKVVAACRLKHIYSQTRNCRKTAQHTLACVPAFLPGSSSSWSSDADETRSLGERALPYATLRGLVVALGAASWGGPARRSCCARSTPAPRASPRVGLRRRRAPTPERWLGSSSFL